jgi:hypothetical protein
MKRYFVVGSLLCATAVDAPVNKVNMASKMRVNIGFSLLKRD